MGLQSQEEHMQKWKRIHCRFMKVQNEKKRHVSEHLFKVQEGSGKLEVMIRQNLPILAGIVTKRAAGALLLGTFKTRHWTTQKHRSRF